MEGEKLSRRTDEVRVETSAKAETASSHETAVLLAVTGKGGFFHSEWRRLNVQAAGTSQRLERPS